LKLDHQAVLEAAARIAGAIVQTPLVESQVAGAALWLKCECLQTGGAFKLRGASNRLLAMDPAERGRGVVGFSSGNHALGLAIAARRLGMAATIVMPADAPALKIEGTRHEGARVVLYDRLRESREAIAAQIAASSGAIVVPSFDDPFIVAGQGTAGLEIAEQMRGSPTRIVTPCGGGGLAAGLALACPQAAITIVEPEGWDDMKMSLAGGRIVAVENDAPPTLCDALQTPRVAARTFDILRARGADALSVSEDEVVMAVRWAWRTHGLVVEPGGAAGLAAVLAGKQDVGPGTAVILSGGNIDPALHARIVAD
jgi:threonine dehydratase